jgi:cellulose synthase/poly-beta-1,6-N-acetylglucosamine synthase-like glycosyltransferase
MGSYWLATISSFYKTCQPEMIIGLTDMCGGKGFFGRFQEVEFTGIVAAGAGAAAAGHPLYCNGSNLAFRRELFNSFLDPMQRQVVSGDDTLFMLSVKEHHSRDIRLLKSQQSVVLTKGVAGPGEFFDQRRRWLSKSSRYGDSEIIITALLVLMNTLSILLSLGLLVTGLNLWLFPVIYLGKTWVDKQLTGSLMRFYGKNLYWPEFLVFGLLYPFYVVWVVISGFFAGSTWKKRRY